MDMTPEKRKEFEAQGTCTKCGCRPALPNRKRCQGCRDHDAVWQEANKGYYEKYQRDNAEQIKEAARLRYAEDPEYGARKSREWFERLKADPEHYEQYKTEERERGRKKRRAQGIGPKPPLLSLEEKRRRTNAKSRQKKAQLRGEMLVAYGSKCTCCGEAELKFLCLDHIDRKRPEEGKVRFMKGKNRPEATHLWRWLKREGWPQEGYQLLCWNCNQVTRWGDPCPHQEK